MQGHFEGSQPSPYANISVNNPSRFTNSNLVNRRYMEQQQQQQGQSSQQIKPVIPRRRTANNANQNHSPVQGQLAQQASSTAIASQPVLNSQEVSQSERTTSPQLTQDIKPNLQTLNMPQYNGTMPLVTNLPNMEIATLFTFNQNYQNHN